MYDGGCPGTPPGAAGAADGGIGVRIGNGVPGFWTLDTAVVDLPVVNDGLTDGGGPTVVVRPLLVVL